MPQKNQTNPIVTLPYGRQWIDAADKQAVLDVLDSDFLTQGPLVERFEHALAKNCGARFAVVFSSGTAALHAACHVAGLKAGDIGITSPISFAASANAILYTGAQVQFADINPETAQITAATIAPALTRKTKVIIPVDLCGRPSELEQIHHLAHRHGAIVIQDAAHSLGGIYHARHKGKDIRAHVGSCINADMCCFSFHPVKTITTGEGGAVTTNNEDFYHRLIRFRQHGITKDQKEFEHQRYAGRSWYYEQQELGFNYRLSDLQCALGLSQLKTLNERVERRATIAKTYFELLADEVGFLHQDDTNHSSAHHLVPILVDPALRDSVFEGLRQMGIGVQLHYIPIYRHPYYRRLMKGLNVDQFPHAEDYFRSAISLPVYPTLEHEDVIKVSDVIKMLLKKTREAVKSPVWGESTQHANRND